MPQTDPHNHSAPEGQPCYLTLDQSGELARRAKEALASLEKCQICPRGCGANRLAGFIGTCESKRHARISSYFPHHGEENCLSGIHGSGTIFFSQCSLRCVFCQNYDISQTACGQDFDASQLAAAMLWLQRSGCHNLNFVTPDHVVPQILEALLIAIPAGLRLPLVYNTSGYTSQTALAWLDGVIDIYMPDYKTASSDLARRWLQAKDYPTVAAAAIREMYRQVGNLEIDRSGLARRGLMVRHLVMPGADQDTRQVMEDLAAISPDLYLNLMAQYHPAGKALGGDFPELGRTITTAELSQAYHHARAAGLWRFDH